VNLAYKAYHNQRYKLYPNLVPEYIHFKQDGYQTFDVEGIEGNKQGLTVDVAITYYKPFFHKGEEVKIKFALSNSLTTRNTILGFPSTVPMKSAMVHHDGFIRLEIFNEQFLITTKVPSGTATLPNVMDTNTPPSKQDKRSHRMTYTGCPLENAQLDTGLPRGVSQHWPIWNKELTARTHHATNLLNPMTRTRERTPTTTKVNPTHIQPRNYSTTTCLHNKRPLATVHPRGNGIHRR
jgi:hypothetical protein